MPKLNECYLDFASSTPVYPEVLTSYSQLLPLYYANSNALHLAGLNVAKMLEESRLSCAKQLNVNVKSLSFVSGATLANNVILKGIAKQYSNRGKHIITSAIEHASVLEVMKDLEKYDGFDLTILNVNENGIIEDTTLLNALREDTILVSIMAVNNEIGTILPVEHYAKCVHENSKAFFHTDAVQALAKHDIDLNQVDAASFTAHKIHGLKGSGLIYLKPSIQLFPLISGGHSANERVPGTPDACAHILFAKTLRLAKEEAIKSKAKLHELNSYLREQLLTIDSIVINSPSTSVSDYIVNFSCLDLPSQVLLNILSEKGIYASAAATCSDQSFKPSHVLMAMKKDEACLKGVIRISLSASISKEDIDRLITTIRNGIKEYAR